MDDPARLRHLWERDRVTRYCAYAGVVVVWLAISWADPRLLLLLLAIAASLWLHFRRTDRDYAAEAREELDLL